MSAHTDSVLDFRGWPKIPRIASSMVLVTEKLDGTSACLSFDSQGNLACQSRRRIVTPDDDNYGFAAWCETNRDSLWNDLGVGKWFGEWWGGGCQRGYGLAKGDMRFSLFNTQAWAERTTPAFTPGLGAVPVLASGVLYDIPRMMDDCLETLVLDGSRAVPGYRNPEGYVVDVAGTRLKEILNSPGPKSAE